MAVTSPTTSGTPSVGRAISLMYKVLLRSQFTKGKLLGLGFLGLLAIVVAYLVAGGNAEDAKLFTAQFIAYFGISLVVPLVCLLIASNVLGNLIEDRLLVYVWLKPLPRWYLAVAAYLASLTVALPLAVVPVTLAAAVTGYSDLVGPTLLATVMGSLAYCGLFTALGVRFARGLWWGLLYILIWENLIASIGSAGKLSISKYCISILERALGDANPRYAGDIVSNASSTGASIIVPLLFATLGLVYAGLRLQKRDVD